MKVLVHFFGNIRSMAGRPEQSVELSEGSTIRDLLDYLMNRYTKMAGILSREKIRKSHVLIIHGEEPVNDYGKILTEGDKLYLFIMLAGG